MSIDPGLAPRPHRFRLDVIGTSGLRSQPTEMVVTTRDGAGAEAIGPGGYRWAIRS